MARIISKTISIWMSGSGLPVSTAFTSATSPILMPRKVTGAPGFRPRTDPGKYTENRSRFSNQPPALKNTTAATPSAIAPRTNAPTRRGCVFALTAAPGSGRRAPWDRGCP